jgi:hypothetical protein
MLKAEEDESDGEATEGGSDRDPDVEAAAALAPPTALAATTLHSAKINWLASLGRRLYVADTGSSIVEYMF